MQKYQTIASEFDGTRILFNIFLYRFSRKLNLCIRVHDVYVFPRLFHSATKDPAYERKL